MTDSSFQGYARGEGFRPYEAPYGFLDRQIQKDEKIIRNLQQQRQEFDERASQSESDMARVFERQQELLAENQRIEDLYFDNRRQAVELKYRREIEDVTTQQANLKRSFDNRKALVDFAPKLLENLVTIKQGIDEARLEAATNYAIANIMPGVDQAYSEKVQEMRDHHDSVNSIADAMQASGLPQRAVTYIRRSSNLSKYVELQQAAKNLTQIYGNELKRRVLEKVQDPTDPHQVAYATEAVQIELLKEHGLYGYNADFLHDLYVQMKAHRNQSILDAEYKRDLQFEQQTVDTFKNAAFADFNPQSLTDYVKALRTYRDKNGAYRGSEQVLAQLFQTFAENPQHFRLEDIQDVMSKVDDGTGQSLYSRVENTTRWAEFVRNHHKKRYDDHKIQKNIDQVKESELRDKTEYYLKYNWDGSREKIKQLKVEFDQAGFSSEFLNPYLDRSNETRTDIIRMGIEIDDALKKGTAGTELLKYAPEAIVSQYKTMLQKAELRRDSGGGRDELEARFRTSLRTSLGITDPDTINVGLESAVDHAMALYYKDLKLRIDGSGDESQSSMKKSADASFSLIQKQILNQEGKFETTSFERNRGDASAYFPAFVPKSKITPSGKALADAIISPQQFSLVKDPLSAIIASKLELQTINAQIEQNIPVKISDKYYQMFRAHPTAFKSPADVINHQLSRAGFTNRLGEGVQEQLSRQTNDVSLKRLIEKINSPQRLAMAGQLLKDGVRDPKFMTPRVAQAYGSRKFVLDTIASVESGAASYNAVNQKGVAGGRKTEGFSGDFRKMPQHGGRPLTNLDVREVLELQFDDRSMTDAQWFAAGKLHAVGRYQFIGNTLRGLVERAGVSLDAKFDEATQDRLALQLFKERGYQPWVGVVDNISDEIKRELDRIRGEMNG